MRFLGWLRFLEWLGINVVALTVRTLLGVGILSVGAIVIVLLGFWLVLWTFLKETTTAITFIRRGKKIQNQGERRRRTLREIRRCGGDRRPPGEKILISRWFILGVVLVVIIIAAGLTYFLGGAKMIGIGVGIAFGIIALLAIAYLAISVRIIGPTETGIVVRLGNPIRITRSGIHLLLPRRIENVVRYPTTQYRLDYLAREVITTRGYYGEGEEREWHSRAVLKVDITLYFRWPRTDDLIESLRTAPPPGMAQVLFDHFEDFSIGTVRSVCGRMTWGQVTDTREEIRTEAEGILKNSEDSPFKKARISDVVVTLEEVKLPPNLEGVITVPQEETLRRRGVEQQAQAERIFTEEQGKAYRGLGAWGPLAALFTLLAARKTR